MVEWTTALSRSAWQATQVRTPGSASRRFFGIGSPQSSHSVALSPFGVSARAKHGVLHGIVDLVLHRAVARPSAGHVTLLPTQRANARQGFFGGAT